MIDVKELRIGNYVLAYNTNYDAHEVRRVFGINGKSASLEKLEICIQGGQLKKIPIDPQGRYVFTANPCVEQCMFPIPITEYILLKCGFEKKEWGSATVYYHHLIELDEHFCLKGVDYNIQVKSLHQLQNLYFYLTGSELEVYL